MGWLKFLCALVLWGNEVQAIYFDLCVHMILECRLLQHSHLRHYKRSAVQYMCLSPYSLIALTNELRINVCLLFSWDVILGWERHTSSRGGGALFLHNPTTGESRWFDGWVEKKSRWYGRKYWFQPTTGRAEWELPGKEFSQSPLAATSGGAIGGSGGGGNGAAAAPEVPKPSNDKVKSWMEKIKAAKAKAVATGGEQERHNTEAPGSYSGAGKRMHSRDRDPTVANLHIHKRRREEGDDGGTNDGDEAVSDDNMELDDDDDDDDDVQFPSAAAVAAAAAAAMPSEVLQPPLPPPPPREDVPSVAVRRERLRQDCLNRFAEENERYGAMSGVSKTSRCCRTEGMASGLSGMFGRCGWAE